MYKHKTGSLGAAYLAINDMRVHEIMKLYVEYVRPKFLKFKSKRIDVEDKKLTVFLDQHGQRMKNVNCAVEFFKKNIIAAGEWICSAKWP